MIIKHFSDVIDIWNEPFPDCTPVLRWHSKSYHPIKLTSKEIGVFVPAEELLEGIFLFCVECKLFFTYIPENLVV